MKTILCFTLIAVSVALAAGKAEQESLLAEAAQRASLVRNEQGEGTSLQSLISKKGKKHFSRFWTNAGSGSVVIHSLLFRRHVKA